MAKIIQQNIDADFSKGIVAVWHDESHLNHFYNLHNDLFHILPVAYMYPEDFNGTRGKLYESPAKIIALKKDHREFRLDPNKKTEMTLELAPPKPKVAVIIYHADIHKIYKQRWYSKCIETILHQTYQEFDILELNYGTEFKDSILQYFPLITQPLYFWYYPLKNHAFAMNFLLDKAFRDLKYDFVFNVNMDDYYHSERFASQLRMMQFEYFDLVSCNFHYISEDKDEQDVITNTIDVYGAGGKNFSSLRDQLLVHNVNLIAHPAVCFSKNFWRKFDDLVYADELPKEDLELWKRAIRHQMKLKVMPDVLLYYRLHGNQICTNKKMS